MALSSKEGRLKWEPFPPGAKDDTKQERLFGELRGKTVILLHSFKVALTWANVICIYLLSIQIPWQQSQIHPNEIKLSWKLISDLSPGCLPFNIRYRNCLSDSCVKSLSKFPQPEKAKAFDTFRADFKSWGSPTVFQVPHGRLPGAWLQGIAEARQPPSGSAAHPTAHQCPGWQATARSKEPSLQDWLPAPRSQCPGLFPPLLDTHHLGISTGDTFGLPSSLTNSRVAYIGIFEELEKFWGFPLGHI